MKNMNILDVDDLDIKLRRVLSSYGYTNLNEIQLKAMKYVKHVDSLLIVAPTGAGKTEAAFFPILNSLVKEGNAKPIYALYITPLRALNRDIFRRLKNIVNKLNYRMEIRHGDTPEKIRRRMALRPPHILITTPETLQFLLVGKRIREWLRNIQWIVVDELHEIMDNKRGLQLTLSLERLRDITYKKFKRIALSATISNPLEAAKYISGGTTYEIILLSKRKNYDIKVELVHPQEIKELKGEIFSQEFISRIYRIYRLAKNGGVLIFTNTRDTAEVLGNVLRNIFSLKVRVHHGSLSREERIEVEEEFKKGEIKAVIATSSLELGIDIGHINLVIQYSSPRQAIRLVQRVGRAGHKLSKVSRGIIIPLEIEDLIESTILARRARRGDLEEITYEENALDVLSHQIAGLVMTRREISLEDIHNLFSKAFPYKNLSFSELRNLVIFLDRLGIIRFDRINNIVRRGRRTLEYYFSSASTIPERSTFDVIDLASRRIIGKLDTYYIPFLESGKDIILSGRTWTIQHVDMDMGKVEVKMSNGNIGEPPIWIGEMLPVSWKTAREIGAFYRRVFEALTNENLAAKLREEYFLDKESFQEVFSLIKRQVEDIGSIPSDKNILVEYSDKMFIINTFLGTRGNNALSLLLAYALRGFYGSTVKFFSDPYRVLIVTSMNLDREKIETILTKGLKWAFNNYREAIRDSNAYNLKLIQVAQRMGIIEKGKIDSRDKNLVKYLRFMKNTPLDEEAIRETMVEYFNFRVVKDFIKKINSNKVSLTIVKRKNNKFSPISSLIFAKPSVKSDIIASRVPIPKVIEIVKKRLINSRVRLLCIHCLRWEITLPISYIREQGTLTCPICGSKALAIFPSYRDDILNTLRKWRKGEKLSNDEKRVVERARTSAALFISYGYKAALVLAGRGVGPITAKRILSLSKDENQLVKEVFEAETNYSRNRHFWTEN